MTSNTDLSWPDNRGVFCNRTLNLRPVGAIGYDMDYTLIQYRSSEWEARAFHHAKMRLLDQGWPVESLEFDPHWMIQGLIVDTKLGNLLKANRFGFVRRALHGSTPLEYKEQRRCYARTIADHRDDRFVFMSTLFSLSESALFAQLVDLWDGGELPAIESYADLYRRVRRALDEAHRAGALKEEIVAEPERFVLLDAETPLALLDQRDAGKKLLLITNSDWSYTRQMMSFAFDRFLPPDSSWRDLFDLVIVSARKPDYFQSSSPLLEVVDESGMLKPIEGTMVSGRVYFGGNASLVENHLQLSGDQILYVGDHFFGDVHATKSTLRWRTALVVRELEDELTAAQAFRGQQHQLEDLMAKKERLEQSSCQLRTRLQRHRRKRERLSKNERAQFQRELAALKTQLQALDDKIAPLAKAAAELGNKGWGPLMRAGNDKSYLAHLIERHADIYTSRVSNFLHATPYRFFRSARGDMPHDGSQAVRRQDDDDGISSNGR